MSNQLEFLNYPNEGWWSSSYLVNEQPFGELSDGDCSSVRVGNRALAAISPKKENLS